MIGRRSCFALIVTALAALAMPAAAQTELRFAVTDVVGMENLQREWGPFQKLLEDKTGFKLAFFPVTFGSKSLEAAVMTL